MQTVRPSSEAEMVALFLETEYPSLRTHQRILQVLQREGWPARLIEQPNLHDEQENAQRRRILEAFRGYGQNPNFFAGLPPDVEYLDRIPGHVTSYRSRQRYVIVDRLRLTQVSNKGQISSKATGVSVSRADD